jgi:HemY protein
MIRALVFLALVAVAALGAQWLLANPGTVSFVWLGYKVQTSVFVALAAAALVAFAVTALWSLVRFVFRLPRAVSLAAKMRSRNRGYEALSRGMIAIGAGDARTARREAGEAARLIKYEPLTLLLRAQAAQLSGDRATARALFQEMAKRPDTKALGLRGLYVEARRAGEGEAAFAFAEEAQKHAALPWAAQALIERHAQNGDWEGALAALERAGAGGQIDKQELARSRAALRTAVARDVAEREPDRALDLARAALSDAPGLVPAAALAARIYARKGDLRRGAKIVEAIWTQAPHPDLAQAYADLRPGDSTLDRLARGRKLAQSLANDPESRLMVADLAVAAREYREAREALAPLTQGDARPTARVCAAMARLAEAEGDAAKAREWWGRATRAPRDKAWIADGMAFERWEPVSPASGDVGVFEWKTPDERLAPPIDLPETIFEPPAALIEAEASVSKTAPAPKAIDVVASAPAKPAEAALKPTESAKTAETAKESTKAPTAPKPSESVDTAQPTKETAGESTKTAGVTKPVESAKPTESINTAETAKVDAGPKQVVFPMAKAPDDPGVTA